MNLLIGSLLLGMGYTDVVAIVNGEQTIATFDLAELIHPQQGRIAEHLSTIDKVIIGFADIGHLDFLAFMPNVTEVHIMTSKVTDISGLRFLGRLTTLIIERANCRMDVLGELTALATIFLDGWRPGAERIFELHGLVNVNIRKYKYADLTSISHWEQLKDLRFSDGGLVSLNGIPKNIENLELTNMRRLESLSSLNSCRQLRRLVVINCRQVNSLSETRDCRLLETLSIARSSHIESLTPLRNLKNLQYLFLADGTIIDNDVDVLYTLRSLKKLIISKRSGLDPQKLHELLPDCELIVAS